MKNMQKEIGFLEREMERPRDNVSAKKILLAILAVCIMSAKNHRRDSEKSRKQKRLR